VPPTVWGKVVSLIVHSMIRIPGSPLLIRNGLGSICVDTIFGHVSLNTYLELMRSRSARRKSGGWFADELPMGLVPMGKRRNMTKSRSSDGIVPMTSTDGCR